MGSKINGRGRVVSIIYSLSLDDNNIASPLRAAVLYIDPSIQLNYYHDHDVIWVLRIIYNNIIMYVLCSLLFVVRKMYYYISLYMYVHNFFLPYISTSS